MDPIQVDERGTLTWRGKTVRAALGRNGVRAGKQEGDGATPLGCFPLRQVYYRPDRVERPVTALPVSVLTPSDGWCDDPADRAYNTFVALPYPAHTESLFRDDHLYDLMVVLGYNDAPPVPRKGSAVFMHLAREDYAPTDGCIALGRDDLLDILRTASEDTLLCMRGGSFPDSARY